VQFEAALSRKAGAINLQNRTEAWEFLYDNSDKKLKSGMFANCTVSFQRSAPSFVVPVTAIVTTQEKRFVIRLSDGQAEWVDIRTGITLSDAIEIFGNLSEGDILVQRGNDEIQPGKRLVAK
jgi:6-phosphogluconate dehydrogenase (decarboxylating)